MPISGFASSQRNFDVAVTVGGPTAINRFLKLPAIAGRGTKPQTRSQSRAAWGLMFLRKMIVAVNFKDFHRIVRFEEERT
jgi:hypothetical protein